jgi:murein DD-endopeptidase MepM/ murein hydrolase activator NlpD
VTWAEAVRELGVEPGADRAAIRRAYLRLVKIRSPERDPEGFKRLRLAYELALEGGDSGSLEDAPHSSPVATAPSAEQVGSPAPRVPASDEVPLAVPAPPLRHTATEPREYANELLGAFAVREDAGMPTTELLRPGIEVYLALLEEGDLGTAARVVVALDRAARGSASLLRAFGPEAALRWSLASELWAAHRGLPVELVARLAEAIRTDDFGFAAANLVGLRKARPDVYAATARALTTLAPTVAKRLEVRLGDWTADPPKAPAFNYSLALAIVISALFGLSQLLRDPGRAYRPSTWGIPGLQSQTKPKSRIRRQSAPPPPSQSAPVGPQDPP